MKKNMIGFTRRDFLKGSLLASAGISLPILGGTSLTNSAWGGALDAYDDRILVILELAGGNDGLNTVVPYGNDAYYNARPNLGLKKPDLLPLNDYLALNGSLKGLKELYDDGNLAVINGVGYPNPNRSHFRSMEIWRTASDSDQYEHYGWIGNYLDEMYTPESDPLFGVAIASEFPQSFHCRDGLGVAFKKAGQFRWQEGNGNDKEKLFRELNKTGNFFEDESDVLNYLRNVTSNIAESSDRVVKIANQKRRAQSYPRGNPLSDDLKTVADLIVGGIPTKIYYVSTGGFDTHANQANSHKSLMIKFGDALNAFMKDMKANNLSDRVCVLCYSEFGRRVKENASQGTDHGTAGPMFVAGNQVNPGIHGKYPSLVDLDRGDLKYEVDFRSVYHTVLESWLHAKPEKVLGKSYENLGFLKA